MIGYTGKAIQYESSKSGYIQLFIAHHQWNSNADTKASTSLHNSNLSSISSTPFQDFHLCRSLLPLIHVVALIHYHALRLHDLCFFVFLLLLPPDFSLLRHFSSSDSISPSIQIFSTLFIHHCKFLHFVIFFACCHTLHYQNTAFRICAFIKSQYLHFDFSFQ